MIKPLSGGFFMQNHFLPKYKKPVRIIFLSLNQKKMRIFLSVCCLLLWSFFTSCNSSDPSNSRAYVTGKIVGTQVDYNKVTIKIISDNISVATTIPDSSGDFTLSGPLPNQKFSLALNQKIKSFSASKNGCERSSDQLRIEIPIGTTYITFHEIILE
ncbi:hypothetical protein ACM44_03425 [Chryseobacterium koreense CCUG 49689]|uniref:Uncharacterized protein n=2 Tax=Chryseobacterium koreense TaxID=232216 RepID=A0A0J7J1H1_9FLAO|nr:hypothetical protein ACM44_03425 [Chryseobacterium koreense CCUG 49689]